MKKYWINILVFLLLCFQCATVLLAQEKQSDFVVFTDLLYAPGDTLKADIFLPVQYTRQNNPILIFTNGFGSDFRKWGHYTTWAKLAATQGFASVLYASRKDFALQNVDGLLRFLAANQSVYHLDTAQIAIYAGSGNVPAMLPAANQDSRIKAALICYGSAQMETFRLDMPVLLVRAGLDNVQLNKNLDTLAFQALQSYAPYTVVSYSIGSHPFEDVNDPEALRCMKACLDFLKTNMSPSMREHLLKKENEITAMRELYRSNWSGALTALQKALQNNPGNDETERQIGNVHIELKEYDKAIQAYDRALQHGNWRKGEIAQKKCLANAMLERTEACITEMRVLKTIGWFEEADYIRNPVFEKIVSSESYRIFIGK